MSAVLIRSALEVALAAVSPAIATAWENVPYAPVPGTAYQAVFLILAQPASLEMSGRIHRDQGYMQVNLLYPLDSGPAAAATQAEAIRSAFYAGRALSASGVTVFIEGTPEIAPAQIGDDRYMVPVKVRFFANIVRS